MPHVRCFVHRTEVRIPVISDSRGVPQEIADRNLFSCWNSVWLARCRFDQHFGILEFGQVLRDRIFKHKASLFAQHHRRNTGNRFSHRTYAEHCIRVHRLAGFPIHHSLRLTPHHTAATRHQRHCARDSLLIDTALYRRANPAQAFRRQSCGFWLGCRQFLCNRAGGNGEHANQSRGP